MSHRRKTALAHERPAPLALRSPQQPPKKRLSEPPNPAERNRRPKVWTEPASMAHHEREGSTWHLFVMIELHRKRCILCTIEKSEFYPPHYAKSRPIRPSAPGVRMLRLKADDAMHANGFARPKPVMSVIVHARMPTCSDSTENQRLALRPRSCSRSLTAPPNKTPIKS